VSGKLTADGWVQLRFAWRGGRREPVAVAAAADGLVFVDRAGMLQQVDDTGPPAPTLHRRIACSC
jgi:hypothetical protein